MFCPLIRSHTRVGATDVQHSGRRAKFASLVAAFGAVRFHYHLCRYVLPDAAGYGEDVKRKLMACEGTEFEVRCGAPDDAEGLHKVLVSCREWW